MRAFRFRTRPPARLRVSARASVPSRVSRASPVYHACRRAISENPRTTAVLAARAR